MIFTDEPASIVRCDVYSWRVCGWTACYRTSKLVMCGDGIMYHDDGASFGFGMTVCKTVRHMLLDRCLSCLSVTLVY